MLSEVIRLARPDIAAIVITIPALIEVELQIIGGAVKGINQCTDIGSILNERQSLGIIFSSHGWLSLKG